jgi:hypothetical protein
VTYELEGVGYEETGGTYDSLGSAATQGFFEIA